MIELASFWVGDRLSPLEQASAISFMAQGHKLYLYAMDDISGVPPGVVLRDAREILLTENIVRHAKSGSPALHSDLFRYALLGKTDQTWVDLDIIALQPLLFENDYIFGYESEKEVNGAILKLPQKSQALSELLAYSPESYGYPPYFSKGRKFRYFLKSFGKGLPITEWPWGSIGPRALTFHPSRSSEIKYALPIDSFYPIPFEQAERFLIPGSISQSSFSEKTLAVHFWGSSVRNISKQKYNGSIPLDSYLGAAIRAASEWANIDIPTHLS